MRLTHLFALSGLAILAAQGMAQAYNIDPLTRRAYAPVVKPQAVAPAPTITASTNTSTNSGTFNDSVPIVARETVSFSGNYEPGTLVVSTSERRMYLVLENGKALRYGVGVGRPGFEWGGETKITQKREWPDWTPPPEMLKRRPDLPRYMKGGPDNPLGARAMYLGSSLYRIHGSNEPESIGQAVSSGCIRMVNEDVIDLYERVKVGASVIVMR
ncbi:MAG: L,D-transpeptidase [Hyphomicrobiales bacterium]|nr:L,D-transpeptidase [Hyphomicrobiales bacterium]NBS02554.1 L,D-transpeptidase [Hyphomicrobiales bacterium]